MSVVFISYEHGSRALVEALAEDINALGHTVWYDRELTGGQLWWDKILESIRTCDVFIPLLTPRSIASTPCEREHAYAHALGRLILPVLAADGVSVNLLPPALAMRQFVDYRSRDRNAALRLARSFAALPSASPLPDPLPDPPEVPASYLGKLAERLTAPATLSYEEQSVLLVDVRRGLKDSETAEDARSLLQQFRKRRDLLAVIAQDIDELLASPRLKSGAKTESVREVRPDAKLTKKASTSRRSSVAVSQQTPKEEFVAEVLELRTLKGHTSSVRAVAVTPDGRRAVSASKDVTLKVRDLGSGRKLRTLERDLDLFAAVAVTPDGRRAVSASSDGTLKVWDLGSGRDLLTLTGHTHSVNAVAVTPDGQRAVSASQDVTLKVWDLGSGRELASFLADSELYGRAIAPDGETILTGDRNGVIHVLRLS